MKIVLFAMASLISFSTQAASQVYVSSNMFLASGAGETNYHINTNKIYAEVKKVSTADLGQFSFAGAMVNTEKNSVRYNFHRLEKSDVYEVCWAEVAFTGSKDTQGQSVISDVNAKLSCTKNDD